MIVSYSVGGQTYIFITCSTIPGRKVSSGVFPSFIPSFRRALKFFFCIAHFEASRDER